ncbi:MAG TPA: patatin-like protein [Candidatus Binatia bacterium]|nr:patatin-like protein [Candidatus Binatia bacterium]
MSTTTSMAIEREVRFAVVLYGGVSLAIYINGVAQELFHLVRATAVDPVDAKRPFLPEVKGSEKVYRRLGQLLGLSPRTAEELPTDMEPVRTKFVVDILSGTSAGGINAIYLSKALANDQDFKALQQLWYDEGDIGRLINDAESYEGVPKIKQEPPKSLLNSKRMYYKLLQAFDGMDAKAAVASPYVEEIDLFVTTTDLRGLPLALRLADRVVFEERHRKVFHFRYDKVAQYSDFKQDDNPFLAYAARCTSSFPFAFEPMRLEDIKPFAEIRPEWARFFFEDPKHYVKRPFADGGYLDNKPFSYAIDMLGTHRASVPVDRKLIYVEPSPEHPEDKGQNFTPPNAIQNVLAFDMLAHDETIREDLQRILARNRLLERVERFLSGMETDLALREPTQRVEGEKFAQTDLADKIKDEGIAYGGYHRLKVSALTEWLASLVARAADVDLESDDFIAVRYLMRAWREAGYAPLKGAQPTENSFLMDYDLPYRIRRLEFVLQRMDAIAALDDVARERLRRIDLINQHIEETSTREESPRRSSTALRSFAVTVGTPSPLTVTPDGRRFTSERPSPQSFRDELSTLRGALSQQLAKLRGAEENLTHEVTRFPLQRPDLHDILNAPTDAARLAKAADLVRTHQVAVVSLAEALRDAISQVTKAVGVDCEALLNGEGRAAHEVARHYYFTYERYDLISFPILYATAVGDERDSVEVIRVSPEDATSIVNERASGRHKLAGLALMHFGAFLDRSWRQNDLLWGRLDGAERLITTLLAGTAHADQTDALVLEAQVAILDEHFGAADRGEFSRVYTEAVLHAESADTNAKALGNYAAEKLRDGLKDKVQTTMRAALDGTQIRDYLRGAPDTIDRTPNPEASVRELARSTTVVGQILQGISTGAQLPTGPATWITRIGQILWGLVEVSVPRRMPTLLFRYWLQLAYLFDLLLIGGGFVFAGRGVRRFGLVALAATLALHLVTFLLADILQGRIRRALLLRWLGAAVAGGIVAAAAYDVALRLNAVSVGLQGKAIHLDAGLMVAIVGAIASVFTISGAVLAATWRWARATHRPRLPDGIKLPGLALELMREPDEPELVKMAGPIDGPVRDTWRAQTDLDFVVIASYWALLVALSGLCVGLSPIGVWLGGAAAIAATAAAFFDVLENLRTYAVLDATSEIPARLRLTRQASRCKWGALFSAVGLIGGSMLSRAVVPLWLVGGSFVVTAVVGGVGVIRHNRMIQTGYFMLLVAFVLVAVLFGIFSRPVLIGLGFGTS